MIKIDNYSNYPWRLEDLKEICNKNIVDILGDYETFVALHEDEGITNIVVRYIIDKGKFGYAEMGDFFFVDDCMYVISDDDMFKDICNDEMPSIASDFFGTGWYRSEKYVTRVVFAGVRTPFKDNLGDWIYTGDIVRVGDDIVSGVCAFPPYTDNDSVLASPALYGLMLDNCMQRLDEGKTLERLGTVFFGLDIDETEIDIEQIIGGAAQHGGFNEDFLLCARYTPSYEKDLWKYQGLEILGAEYNWRR